MTPEEEVAWIRKKLGLEKESTWQELFGKMHVVCSHSASFMRYIETYKCNDKEGEIARLTNELNLLKIKYEED